MSSFRMKPSQGPCQLAATFCFPRTAQSSSTRTCRDTERLSLWQHRPLILIRGQLQPRAARMANEIRTGRACSLVILPHFPMGPSTLVLTAQVPSAWPLMVRQQCCVFENEPIDLGNLSQRDASIPAASIACFIPTAGALKRSPANLAA